MTEGEGVEEQPTTDVERDEETEGDPVTPEKEEVEEQ